MRSTNKILITTCILILLIVLYSWSSADFTVEHPNYSSSSEQFKGPGADYYNAMAFQGGGVLGVAYVGALQQLQKKINFSLIKKFAGSSIGAIFAMLMACKIYDWDALMAINYTDFMDKSIGYVGGAKNLFNNKGVYSTDLINDWIGKLLTKHNFSADITFRELYYKTGNELFIVATNLEQTPYTKYFSRLHDPDMPCRKACIISSAFPFVFEPIEYKGHLYCDGGMVNNYPIKILLDTPQTNNEKVRTIGLKLTNYRIGKVIKITEAKPDQSQMKSIFSIAKRLTFITFNLSSDIMTSIGEDNHSIEIDALGQSPLNFTIADHEKLNLIKSGQKAVDAYFD